MEKASSLSESQSAAPAGGMEPVCVGMPKLQTVGRSMVPGKWDCCIHLFLLAAERV